MAIDPVVESRPDEPTLSDGARLLARGVLVRLKDGEHRLIFDYEALEMVEDEFKGLDEFVASLGETRYKANRLRNVRIGLEAGLLHEKVTNVLSLLDPRDLPDYLTALTLALVEAFPDFKVDEDPKGKGSASPGNGSTTSRRSSITARRRRSGG